MNTIITENLETKFVKHRKDYFTQFSWVREGVKNIQFAWVKPDSTNKGKYKSVY